MHYITRVFFRTMIRWLNIDVQLVPTERTSTGLEGETCPPPSPSPPPSGMINNYITVYFPRTMTRWPNTDAQLLPTERTNTELEGETWSSPQSDTIPSQSVSIYYHDVVVTIHSLVVGVWYIGKWGGMTYWVVLVLPFLWLLLQVILAPAAIHEDFDNVKSGNYKLILGPTIIWEKSRKLDLKFEKKTKKKKKSFNGEFIKQKHSQFSSYSWC